MTARQLLLLAALSLFACDDNLAPDCPAGIRVESRCVGAGAARDVTFVIEGGDVRGADIQLAYDPQKVGFADKVDVTVKGALAEAAGKKGTARVAFASAAPLAGAEVKVRYYVFEAGADARFAVRAFKPVDGLGKRIPTARIRIQ